MSSCSSLLNEVKACQICASSLPLGPRPVLQVDPEAKILIAGQAPGKKVHQSGVPFDDASGNRLREWMGLIGEQGKTVFYDPKQIAILPMGFCYPGTGKSGDLPPRKECQPAWRSDLLAHLPNIEITLVMGQYAQAYHFGQSKRTATELVQAWPQYWPTMLPLPHPSPRNNIWLRKNPWFELEVLPALRAAIATTLAKSRPAN